MGGGLFYGKDVGLEMCVCTLFPAVVKCSSVTAAEGGKMSGGGLTYGSVRTFSCNIGYKLGGSSRRMCHAAGSWSGTISFCSSRFIA